MAGADIYIGGRAENMSGADELRLMAMASLRTKKKHKVGRCKLDPSLKAPGFKF